MPKTTLELVFDPALAEGKHSSEGLRVQCNDSGEGQGSGALSRRDFFGPGYVENGKEACLWWLSRFALPNDAGRRLHDLFRWEDFSALWFTDVLVLYPDFWTFPRLLLAARALELFGRGEIGKARILGSEQGLEQVLRNNGVETEMVSGHGAAPGIGSRVASGVSSLFEWLGRGHRGRPWRSSWERSGRGRDLLYTVAPTEWRIPGDGNHRYLADALEELLEQEAFDHARPMVVCAPPSRGKRGEWSEFLSYSIAEKKGVHALGYTSLPSMVRAGAWGRGVGRAVETWLSEGGQDRFRFRDWDFRSLVLPIIRGASRAAMRGVIRYEAVKRALKEIRPGGVLLKDEVYTDGRILSAAARAAGVRTVSLQHGTIYPAHWCYLMDPRAEGLSRPPLPDAFGVYGARPKRMLVEWSGMPEGLLSVIGARRFRPLDRTVPRPELVELASKGSPVLLLAGQMHQDMTRIYDWSFQLMREFPGVQFVVKPHPRDRERAQAIREQCRGLPNAIPYEGPLAEALPVLAATISGHSTSLLESIWRKVPAISVQISGETPADWQMEAGILRIVRTLDDYREAVRSTSEGTLVSAEDHSKAELYLEEFLGYSACRDSQALAALFQR